MVPADLSPTSPLCPTKVWKSDLYRLQQEAPKARPVLADGPVPGRPAQFGGEFHGVLSHQDAHRLLKDDGDYLVRLSAGNDGFHTLSLRFNNKVSHYKLYYDGQFYVRASDKRYETVKDLVADGLVTLHMEQHAAHYIERMHQHSYEQSPYMTLNKLKQRVIRQHSSRKQHMAVVDGLPEKKSALSEAIAVSEGVDQKPHTFRTHTFKGLNWCELCGNFLWGFTAQGVKCEDCGFSAHNRCSEKVPSDCQPDLKNFRGVFGLDLTTLVKAHRTLRPWVVDKCIAEMERRGLTSEGLYRVSGFQDEIASLKLALDKDGEQADLSPQAYDNINVIAGTLKLYLRLLPIPLINFEVHPVLMKAAQASSLQMKLKGIKDALSLLPSPHFHTLKYFVEHLHRVAQLSEINKMTSHNLSTVLAPTLMPTPDLALFSGSIPAMVHEITSLELIISHHSSIFV
ncbi:N-chimaerin [Frankliniella fusca]|uniref:N-chimaerin n=1 Tax=Frankliniella fusca TaxID=407009 RepID=A0AAE1HZA4_9NEOP|nr:N-chimaerin [Frankliniella fusca]